MRVKADRSPTRVRPEIAPPAGAQSLVRKAAHPSTEHPYAGTSAASIRTPLLRAQSPQLTSAKLIAQQRTVGNRAVQRHLGLARASATGAVPMATQGARPDTGGMPPAQGIPAPAVPVPAAFEPPAARDLDTASQPVGLHRPLASGDRPDAQELAAGPVGNLNGSVSPDAPLNDAPVTGPASGTADVTAPPAAPPELAFDLPRSDPVLSPDSGAAATAVEPMSDAAAPGPAFESASSAGTMPVGTESSATIEVQRDFDPAGAIVGAVGSLAGGIGDAAASALGAVQGQLSSLVGGLSSGWEALQSAGGEIVGSIIGAISSGVQTVAGLGAQAGASLQAGFQQASRTISGAGQALMGMVTRGVGQLGGAASAMKAALLAMDGQALRTAYHRLTDMVGGVFSALQKGREALTRQVGALWSGLERGFSTTIAAVRGQAEAIGKRLGAVAEAAGARLSGLWDGLRNRADGMSGIAGAAARLATAVIDRLLASARALWSSIQSRFETVKAGLSRAVASMTEKLGGAWEVVQRGASTIWAGITRAWGAARQAVESLASKAEADVGKLLGNFRGLTIDPVVDKITKISGLVKAGSKAVADPEGAVAPVLNPIIARLESGMPAAGHQKLAEQAGGGAKGSGPSGAGPVAVGSKGPAVTPANAQTNAATAQGPAVTAHRQSSETTPGERSTLSFGQAFDLIGVGLEKGWAQVRPGEMVWKTIKTLLWPWPTVGDEIGGIWDDWKTAASSLFSFRSDAGFSGWLHDLWSNILHLLDFPLVVWRRINNIGLAMWGMITLALMALGAFGGTVGGAILGAIAGFLFGLGIGAAPGAGAGAGGGGFAGAGAGFAVALAVGEALVISFLAAELLSLTKAITELTTARQTRGEQVRDAATAAENTISMGVTLVLMGIGWLGGKVAGVIASAVRRFLPEAVLEAFAKFKKGIVDSRPNPAKTSYEATDPATKPAKVNLVDTVMDRTPDGKPTRITTEVTVESGENGHVTRSYDPATGKLIMEEAFLDGIPDDLQWVEMGGQKMRLQQYITLRQMRMFGIGFGALRIVKMSTIQNVRALIEMDIQLKSGAPKDAAVMKTHSVKYAQRTLVGAGETVKSAKVSGGTTGRIGELTDHFEAHDPSRKPVYDKLLSDNGRTRDSKVFWNYDIELTVEAAPPPEGGNTTVPPVPPPSKDDDE